MTTLKQSIDRWKTNEALYEGVVNGPVNGTVTTGGGAVKTLAHAISDLVGLVPRGDWLTATAYAVKDIARDAGTGTVYVCASAHTSGTLATDVAAGKWAVLQVFDQRPRAENYAGFEAAVTAIGSTSESLVISANTPGAPTVPKTLKIIVERGGFFPDNPVFHGPVVAPPTHIFGGAPTLHVSEGVFAEHFGAVGDGVADDTLAWQRYADAMPVGAVLRGLPGKTYKISCFRALWHTLDLHKMGRYGGVPDFTAGYWYGVRCKSGQVIEKTSFVYTWTDDTTKKPHGFAWGTPDSLTRHFGGGFRDCTHACLDVAQSPALPKATVAIVQSVDWWTSSGGSIESRLATSQNLGTLAYAFDCNATSMTNMDVYGIYQLTVFSFCKDYVVSYNRCQECKQFVDDDKANSNGSITNNTWSNVTTLATNDAAIELGGANGCVIANNTFSNPVRLGIANAKTDVWDTWAMVLDQAGTYSTRMAANIRSEGNVVTGSLYQAWVLGESRADMTKPSIYAPKHCVFRDTYIGCFPSGGSATVGVVEIREGIGVTVDCVIEGSSACGICASSSVADSDQLTYSGLELTVGPSQIAGCAQAGISITYPKRVHFSGTQVRRCGATQVLITRPETRAAVITGDIVVADPVYVGTKTGLAIQSGVWSGWSARFRADSVGHDSTRDFRTTALDASTISMAPIEFLSGTRFGSVQAAYVTTGGHRTVAGSPSGVLTPRFVGEMVWDTTNSKMYLGTGTTSASWAALH